jgi:pyruvate/2-oxoglutarate dehydrogenase complex dihydrolipoamide acyltransferase (E2) component
MKVLQKITAPLESVNDQSLTVINLCFKSGDYVKIDDILIELETSKALLTLAAEQEGYINYFCKIGDEVSVNYLIAQITEKPDVSASIDEKSVKNSSVVGKHIEKDSLNKDYETIFSDKAIKLISQNNIDKSVFKNLDFVSEKNVLNYLYPEHRDENNQKQILTNNNTISKNEIKDNSKVSFKKIPNSKKTEIEYLSSIQNTGLTSTIYMDVDLGSFFESINPSLLYLKDSILPVIVYECSRLLLKYPVLNAYFIDNNIAFYNDVNVGIAMDIDDGLKVVKLPSTNVLTINEIEQLIINLSNKYQERKLETSDLMDVTFTITDLSSNGAYFFTPLINKKTCAILGISKTDTKLNRIILSLAFDHRVTEGKIATTFLYELKERIESYSIKDAIFNTNEITCYKCMKQIKEDIGNIGFIKVVNSLGQDKFICDSCLFYH